MARNKTLEIVGSWIIKPGNSVLVAFADDSIVGVGAVTDAGEITLDYVSAEAELSPNFGDGMKD